MNRKSKLILVSATAFIAVASVLVYVSSEPKPLPVTETQLTTSNIQETSSEKGVNTNEHLKTDTKAPTKPLSVSSFENFENYTKCGFDIDQHQQQLAQMDTSAMNNAEIDHLERVIDGCDAWYGNLNALSEYELEALKTKVSAKKAVLTDLAIFEYQADTHKKAMDYITHADTDISASALFYLLSFDSAFLNKIAEGMNITQIDFLRTNLNLSTLFACQQGHDCSATSTLMQDLCPIDPESCGRSYPELLRTQITPNQYDDHLYALQVIYSIIESGWFEDRNKFDPIDP